MNTSVFAPRPLDTLDRNAYETSLGSPAEAGLQTLALFG